MVYKFRNNKFYPKGLHFGLTTKNEIRFEASFDPSCIYDHHSSDNYDVNKLFGFSTDWYHHWNSARVGWRCINNQNIQILTYTYDKKERQQPQMLGIIEPGDKIVCSILKSPSSFYFTFESKGKSKEILVDTHQYNFPIKYLLFPYFGGNMTAPHDMRLEVTRLKV